MRRVNFWALPQIDWIWISGSGAQESAFSALWTTFLEILLHCCNDTFFSSRTLVIDPFYSLSFIGCFFLNHLGGPPPSHFNCHFNCWSNDSPEHKYFQCSLHDQQRLQVTLLYSEVKSRLIRFLVPRLPLFPPKSWLIRQENWVSTEKGTHRAIRIIQLRQLSGSCYFSGCKTVAVKSVFKYVPILGAPG